jgi:WD40 repeat protein
MEFRERADFYSPSSLFLVFSPAFPFFQCHRKTEGKTQILYPVNSMAFHPKYGTFATGGCDGIVNVWDGRGNRRGQQHI